MSRIDRNEANYHVQELPKCCCTCVYYYFDFYDALNSCSMYHTGVSEFGICDNFKLEAK